MPRRVIGLACVVGLSVVVLGGCGSSSSEQADGEYEIKVGQKFVIGSLWAPDAADAARAEEGVSWPDGTLDFVSTNCGEGFDGVGDVNVVVPVGSQGEGGLERYCFEGLKPGEVTIDWVGKVFTEGDDVGTVDQSATFAVTIVE